MLMGFALLLRFGIPILASSNSFGQSGITLLLFSLGGAILWVWGCCHLAMHFGLSALWGLFGFFFLIGPGVIFWASKQKPKWDAAAIRRPGSKREYRGDPNSPY